MPTAPLGITHFYGNGCRMAAITQTVVSSDEMQSTTFDTCIVTQTNRPHQQSQGRAVLTNGSHKEHRCCSQTAVSAIKSSVHDFTEVKCVALQQYYPGMNYNADVGMQAVLPRSCPASISICHTLRGRERIICPLCCYATHDST